MLAKLYTLELFFILCCFQFGGCFCKSTAWNAFPDSCKASSLCTFLKLKNDGYSGHFPEDECVQLFVGVTFQENPRIVKKRVLVKKNA